MCRWERWRGILGQIRLLFFYRHFDQDVVKDYWLSFSNMHRFKQADIGKFCFFLSKRSQIKFKDHLRLKEFAVCIAKRLEGAIFDVAIYQ